MSEQRLTCVVTRYRVSDDRLVETTAVEQCGYWTERGYLFLGNSMASAPVKSLLQGARAGRDWLAQFGTEPVCVDGSWGGRSYPRIVVGVKELLRVLEGEQP